MQRYSLWHHTEFAGDKALALQYLPEGRKYLGYVVQQCRLSGNFQGQFTRRTQEGVLFVASFVGQVPQLLIDVRALTPAPPVQLDLEGFVVWPEGGPWATGRSVPELVMVPREARYLVSSYDGTELPGGLAGTPFHEPVFPDSGLLHAGNVDWINQAQSLAVSWYGPRSRYAEYFGLIPLFSTYGYPEYSYVFHNGQVLLDLSQEPYASLTGDEFAGVRGAAIQVREEGLVLVVLGINYNTLEDFALAVGLVGNVKTPNLTTDDATARLCGTRAQGADETDDYYHPWFFNPSGTEARCVRNNPIIPARLELICQFPIDEDVSFSTVEHTYLSASTTTRHLGTKDIHQNIEVTYGVIERTDDGISDPTYSVSTAVETDDKFTRTLYESTVTTVVSEPASDGMLFGVDYTPEGEVVYLRKSFTTNTMGTGRTTEEVAGDTEVVFDSVTANAISPVTMCDYVAHGSANATVTHDLNWVNSSTSISLLQYGLSDAPFEISVTSTTSESQDATCELSLAETFSHSWTGAWPGAENDTIEKRYSNALDRDDSVDPYRLGAFLSSVGTSDRARSSNVTASMAADNYDRRLILLHADLRYNMMVYLVHEDHWVGSGTYTGLEAVVDEETMTPHLLEWTATRTETQTYVIERAGEVIYSNTFVLDTSPESGSNSMGMGILFGSLVLETDDQYFDTDLMEDSVFGASLFSTANTLTASDHSPGGIEVTPSTVAPATTFDTFSEYSGTYFSPNWPFSSSPVDTKGISTYGAVAVYKNRYCISIPDPTTGGGANWKLLISGPNYTPAEDGHDLGDYLLNPESAHPIWVLPPVRANRLFPPQT